MGLSRNKVAVSEGAAGSPPFYGECEKAQRAWLVFEIGLEPKRSRDLSLFNFRGLFLGNMFIENRIKNENETDN